MKNGQPSYDPEVVANYVLTAEKNTQAEILSNAIKQTSDVIRVILDEGIKVAAGKFNR
jgi:peptidyl-tRNA hydrolase